MDCNVYEEGLFDWNSYEKRLIDWNIHENGLLDWNIYEEGLFDCYIVSQEQLIVQIIVSNTYNATWYWFYQVLDKSQSSQKYNSYEMMIFHTNTLRCLNEIVWIIDYEYKLPFAVQHVHVHTQ